MRATRALIHTANLRHNLRQLKAAAGRDVRLCLAVKANGYGHDAALVSRVARQEDVYALGVADADEGRALRAAGIEGPIIVYGNPLPGEAGDLVEHGLACFVTDRDGISQVAEEARRSGVRAEVHLKVDTGMGRIGCPPQEATALALLVTQDPALHLAGVCTHFAGADMAEPAYTRMQLDRFTGVLADLRGQGIDPGLVHAANSGALIAWPEALFGMVRVGIAAYGYYPSDEQDRRMDLRPVMELRSRVSFVKQVPPGACISYGMTHRTTRETFIGTVSAGYGDGYSRLLSACGRVSIRGRRYPVVGRVCMDQLMVDLGPETDVGPGDEVVLFGPDPAGPDAEEVARHMQTIVYEVTCLIAARVPRVAVD